MLGVRIPAATKLVVTTPLRSALEVSVTGHRRLPCGTAKNPHCSMAISAEHARSKFAAVISNGDVSIWVKNSRVGRKTPIKQNKQTIEIHTPDPRLAINHKKFQSILHKCFFNDKWVVLLINDLILFSSNYMKLFDSLISDLDASVVKIVLNFVKIELHFKQKTFITSSNTKPGKL